MYAGVWDTVENFLSDFGISGDTAIATAQAFASPTQANIAAVQAAFIAEGNEAPPELIDALWQRYYQAAASNPYGMSGSITNFLSNPTVWIIGGGLIALMIFSRKGR